MAENREEIVYKVPLDLLRFRKENGRISSSVKTHERTVGLLTAADTASQNMLREFLREKDPEKTEELKQLILAEGQRDPGIITADGFLVNGNRRKVAILELREKFPNEDRYRTMKVVILPGEDDEGGRPTLREIEQIENRYQLQAEGKAEYSGFDAALSIRDKEANGYTLEQQMRDDPNFRLMPEKEFKREVAKRRKEMLEPLECVDEYLETIGRKGEYTAISRGLGDPEGRWQAFLDLSQSFASKAGTEKGREKMGIDETEAGAIMQAAYAIIRMRDIPNFAKLHGIMRDLPKYSEHGKRHLVNLGAKVKHELADEEKTNANGEPLPQNAIEEKWKNKYKTEVTRELIKAREAKESGSEKDAPLSLLGDALKKLNHGNMIVDNLGLADLHEALTTANEIKVRAEELKREIYERVKTGERVGMLKTGT